MSPLRGFKEHALGSVGLRPRLSDAAALAAKGGGRRLDSPDELNSAIGNPAIGRKLEA
jgi:hypothetical protein